MKWPFKRQKSILPSEVEDYYKAEARERKGLAWALALGTLVITVVLAFVVFYGARWAYRKIAGTDEQSAPTTTSTGQPPELPGDAATGPMLQGSQPAPDPTPTPTTPPAGTNIPRTGPDEDL